MSLIVCVFCASSNHIGEHYLDAARNLGRLMADSGYSLVYGGGNNGLMGVLSAEMKAHGGKVTGVIPQRLNDLGFAFEGADEMIVTDGMRKRKAIMEERADGFIGLPGGFGTLEELLEIVTLRQLGMLDKPIVFLNVAGFFDGLFSQFEKGFEERFVGETNRSLYYVTGSPEDALRHIAAFYNR